VAVERDKLLILFYGEVSYRDIFGDRHVTHFMLKYDCLGNMTAEGVPVRYNRRT